MTAQHAPKTTYRHPTDGARGTWLTRHIYAHRGLHQQHGPVENSLPAFAAAVEAGYGVECDVRLSADGVAHIFHDSSLLRLTGHDALITDKSSRELADIPLLGSPSHGSSTIARLTDLLRMVNGRTPILIEVKAERGASVTPLCAAVEQDIAAYAGPVAVMSFHPDVARWFSIHAPDVPRGLILTEEGRKGHAHDLLRALLLAWSRADFLAYDVRDLPSKFARKQRRNGLPILGWTVRSPQQWQTVLAEADAPIFEYGPTGTLPNEACIMIADMNKAQPE